MQKTDCPVANAKPLHLQGRRRVALACLAIAAVWCACTSASGAPSHGEQRWIRAKDDVLRDTATGLQWTAADNGADIDWNSAGAFCAGKPSGWRLPTLQELQTLHAGRDAQAPQTTCGESACRTSAQFKLSGAWFWSSTPVGADAYDGVELAWGVSVVNGASTQSVKELSYGSRALCVRD
jgi:hypothetical protein